MLSLRKTSRSSDELTSSHQSIDKAIFFDQELELAEDQRLVVQQ